MSKDPFSSKKSQENKGYLNNPKGGSKKNSLNKESIKRLRNKKIHESIIRNMNAGKELSEVEKEILHNKKIEYVGSKKRTSHIREYTGGTKKRMRNLKIANKIRLE